MCSGQQELPQAVCQYEISSLGAGEIKFVRFAARGATPAWCTSGHLVALREHNRVEGPCCGLCPPLLRALRIAHRGLKETLRGLHVLPHIDEHCSEVIVRVGCLGPQGDGLAVGLACSAPVLLREVTRARTYQFIVHVARLLGDPGCPSRDLAKLLLHHPAILVLLPLLPQPLVEHPVHIPSARVRWAVHAAEVRRRQLLIAAHVADRVLLSAVVHV
eukprot:scaffold88861_cov60-Phaeocystis_antarctica.AAC.4